MPKLTGPFSLFNNLDKIPLEEINFWLKNKLEVHILQNYVANRIFYPQTIATTAEELEIDLAILKEALKREPQVIFNQKEAKITIPQDWEFRFSPLHKLIVNILDVLNLIGINMIYQQTASKFVLLGSAVSPQVVKGKNEVGIFINDKEFKFKKGSVVVLPYQDQKLNLNLKDAYLNQSKATTAVVSGGTLGVVVDLRKGEK